MLMKKDNNDGTQTINFKNNISQYSPVLTIDVDSASQMQQYANSGIINYNWGSLLKYEASSRGNK